MRIKTDDGKISQGVRPLIVHGTGGITTSQDEQFAQDVLTIDGGESDIRDLEVVIDGVGSTITTGAKGDVRIDFDCTIVQWTLLADQSGSIVVDIWKDVYANYPPTLADTITASSEPTLSSTDHNTDAALDGWTTTITAGDTLRFHVDSVTTVTRVTLTLKLLVGG